MLTHSQEGLRNVSLTFDYTQHTVSLFLWASLHLFHLVSFLCLCVCLWAGTCFSMLHVPRVPGFPASTCGKRVLIFAVLTGTA
jgi:hypothetical protein